jgi:hypothetical protein
MAGSEYFDADELLAGREIERDIIRHTNGAALVFSILQLDIQGVRLFVVCNLHSNSLLDGVPLA